MCLAVPAKIIELKENGIAVVESSGIKKDVSISLIENPQVGDFVIVHVGYAINKIDEEEALKTFDLIDNIGIEI